MRPAALLALLCLGGCDEPAPVVDAAPAAKTETFQTAPPVSDAGRLSAADIATLKPVPPTRNGRTPAPLPADARYTATIEKLVAMLKHDAGDPQNPWAIGHGMLALGPEFTLQNGQNATSWLFSEFAEEFVVDGHTFVRFPRKRGDQRIEPHTALMLKVLTETCAPPELAVTVQGKPHTIADLYRGALVSSSLDPKLNRSSFSNTNDMPWALQALTAWAPPPPDGGTDLRWTAADGIEMSMQDFALFNTSVLVSESQFLFDAMQAGAAFEKRGQGIFRFTCGGAHLLQGVAYASGRGHHTDLSEKGLQGQVALMYWRLPRELKVYDDLMKKIDNPQHMLMLLIQRLKFVGHFVESMHKMAILGIYQPTAEHQVILKGAADQIVLTVQALEDQKVYSNLPALRKASEQMYLDVIGDSAHAVRGLRLALGEETLAY